ncbi:S-methyl-5'-thioinosine phosphorylase [Agaribacterium sp. ZY112]|uniref:S-methyl-5'-thioinosine phosphorylase n=1 Tax=Agaribacterium sp. ZY112 TaxID=3233574 RepID=UPI003525EEB6
MTLAVIGGSGLYDLASTAEHGHTFTNAKTLTVATPYGDVKVKQGKFAGRELNFLCRHGASHNVPPHRINYRANIYALKQLGVTHILASNAVGGIARFAAPLTLVLPDQLIDYSWGRQHTFFDEFNHTLSHIDFTQPFDQPIREAVLKAAKGEKLLVHDGGCYACVQGPRLETAAEIRRLKNDGCDLVGMTLMPEAGLAREQGLAYASLCLSVNWAAGLYEEQLCIEEIEKTMQAAVVKFKQLLPAFISALNL